MLQNFNLFEYIRMRLKSNCDVTKLELFFMKEVDEVTKLELFMKEVGIEEEGQHMTTTQFYHVPMLKVKVIFWNYHDPS